MNLHDNVKTVSRQACLVMIVAIAMVPNKHQVVDNLHAGSASLWSHELNTYGKKYIGERQEVGNCFSDISGFAFSWE